MATNECIVHSRKNIFNFHTTINKIRRKNMFSNDIYRELSKQRCSCNGKTGLNIIDVNVLINTCHEILSEKSCTLILPMQPEAKLGENHKRISRFIGKKGRKLKTLEDKYHVLINLVNIDSNKKNIINKDELHISIRRKNKLEKNTIPFSVMRQDIIKKWEETSEVRFIQREFTFDHNSFEFISLSFDSEFSMEARHYITGCFIGKNGQHLHDLENKYNISIEIFDQYSRKTIRKKFIKIEDKDKFDKLYLLITNKNKSTMEKIPIERIEQEINNRWKNQQKDNEIINESDDESLQVNSVADDQ
ncbi:hypothetical protein I4U23_005069 [Adineta vaga]|nr:hypothetical protein I4U23_005069 [Adineta vaga]